MVTVTKIGDRRYRIDGAPETESWAKALKRNGHTDGWCEFSWWPDDGNVGSFGGSVWPSGYPSLFTFEPGYRSRMHTPYPSLRLARLMKDADRAAQAQDKRQKN